MQQWSAIRAKGKLRFALMFGVAWGLPTGLLTWLSLWRVGVCKDPAFDAPLFIVGFMLTGLVWSGILWRSSEKAYLADQQRGVLIDDPARAVPSETCGRIS